MWYKSTCKYKLEFIMGKVVSKTEILPAVNIKEVELAVERITGSWTKTIHALIETAMMLHEYQMSPDYSSIRQILHDRRIIDMSVQQILIGIAGNPTLTDKRYRDLLPPHYSNLGFLSRIKSEKLISLLNKKEITPATTLSDAKILASKFGSLKKPQKTRSDKKQTFKLQLTFESGVDGEAFIAELVEHIEQFDGITVKVH